MLASWSPVLRTILLFGNYYSCVIEKKVQFGELNFFEIVGFWNLDKTQYFLIVKAWAFSIAA
jgi:hypothetical protein